MKKLPTIMIVLLVSICLCVSVSYSASYNIIQLTDNSHNDEDPSLSDGGHVAWESFDGHDAEIFRYDGHIIEQLTDNPYYDALRSFA